MCACEEREREPVCMHVRYNNMHVCVHASVYKERKEGERKNEKNATKRYPLVGQHKEVMGQFGRRIFELIVEAFSPEKSRLRCDAMRCNAMALRCDAMRCDVTRCDVMRWHCDAMRCDAMRCNAMALRCDAIVSGVVNGTHKRKEREVSDSSD